MGKVTTKEALSPVKGGQGMREKRKAKITANNTIGNEMPHETGQ